VTREVGTIQSRPRLSLHKTPETPRNTRGFPSVCALFSIAAVEAITAQQSVQLVRQCRQQRLTAPGSNVENSGRAQPSRTGPVFSEAPRPRKTHLNPLRQIRRSDTRKMLPQTGSSRKNHHERCEGVDRLAEIAILVPPVSATATAVPRNGSLTTE